MMFFDGAGGASACHHFIHGSLNTAAAVGAAAAAGTAGK